MNHSLIESHISGSVALDTDAIKDRDAMIAEAFVFCPCVTNPEEQATAAQFGSKLQGWLRDVERARVDVKAPLLTLSRKIDALAEEAVLPVAAEKARLSRMCKVFQDDEDERVAKEKAEHQRKVKAAQEAADLAVLELARKEAGLESESQLGAAIVAEQAAKAALDAERAVIIATPPPAARAAGSVVRRVPKWELVDIKALYAAAPHLCSLEPNRAAIRACITGDTVIDGLKIWWETDVGFRS